jgi:hypothetical protein
MGVTFYLRIDMIVIIREMLTPSALSQFYKYSLGIDKKATVNFTPGRAME